MGISLLIIASRPALGPIQAPIQWVPGVKRPGCKAGHSHQPSAEVKNAWSYTSSLPISLHSLVLNFNLFIELTTI